MAKWAEGKLVLLQAKTYLPDGFAISGFGPPCPAEGYIFRLHAELSSPFSS